MTQLLAFYIIRVKATANTRITSLLLLNAMKTEASLSFPPKKSVYLQVLHWLTEIHLQIEKGKH